MHPVTQLACLDQIERLWRAAAPGRRPAALWIARHQPLSGNTDLPDTPVDAAWYLDDIQGPQPRQVLDYARFVTVQSGTHWASYGVTPRVGFCSGRNGIGLAAFAAYRDSDLLYLGYLWDGRDGLGASYRLDPTSGRLVQVRELWIS